MKSCQVGPDTVRMLELGHPWVIADRFTKQWPAGKAGELISLQDEQQRHLATALYDPQDRIVARVLDRLKIQLDADWLEKKLRSAQRLRRQHALLEETNAYRLVNSEGDGLPGITVDRYADYLMVQLYSEAWDRHLSLLVAALQKVFQPQGIYRKLRPQETRQLEAKSRDKAYSQLVVGEAAPVPLQVQENGLNYLVDLREGLNTGLFPDQRRNRRELMSRVAGQRFSTCSLLPERFRLRPLPPGQKRSPASMFRKSIWMSPARISPSIVSIPSGMSFSAAMCLLN